MEASVTTEAGATKYQRNPSAEVLGFDVCLSEPRYQVVLNGRHFEVNAATHNALKLFDKPRALADAAALLEGDPTSTVKRLSSALVDNRLVVAVDGGDGPTGGEDFKNRRTQSSVFFLFRHRLVSGEQIAPLTTRLGVLYCRPLFACGVAIIIATHALLFSLYGTHTPPMLLGLDSTQRSWGIVLVYVSLALHELGHAAACRWNKIMHGEIGIALYGFWPVLYADVTGAWRLPRRARVVVDVAGMYLQELFASLCIGIWFCTHWAPLLFCTYCVFIATLINLNPFFRFDGYWVLADSLGVARPRKLGVDALTSYALRLFGRVSDDPTARYGPAYVQRILMAYAVAGIGISAVGLYALVFKALPRLVILDRLAYRQVLALSATGVRWSVIPSLCEHVAIAITSSVGIVAFVGKIVSRCGSVVRAYLP